MWVRTIRLGLVSIILIGSGCDACSVAFTDTGVRRQLDDLDGDGWRGCRSLSASGLEIACDCDDSDPQVFPGGEDRCGDRIDGDCDGRVDESRDADGDGYPICRTQDLAADCDDDARGVHPGAVELCEGSQDEDCDGRVDEGFDRDGDGSISEGLCVGIGDDCDDADPEIGPHTIERCNELQVDEDCDGSVDEGFDQDDDGYLTCSLTAEVPADCDDLDALIHPSAPELCDSLDNDCDGRADEGFDQDEDGWLKEDVCPTPLGRDCDDHDPNVNPSAIEACEAGDPNTWGDDDCDGEVNEGFVEVCNGLDDDCDGVADERIDRDRDGFCTVDEDPGLVDCDDGHALTHPGAPDTCGDGLNGNGVDEDCDGIPDNPDLDMDGVVDQSCGGEDCDDNNSNIIPASSGGFEATFEESETPADEDCDGLVDEGVSCENPQRMPEISSVPDRCWSTEVMEEQRVGGEACGDGSEGYMTHELVFRRTLVRSPGVVRVGVMTKGMGWDTAVWIQRGCSESSQCLAASWPQAAYEVPGHFVCVEWTPPDAISEQMEILIFVAGKTRQSHGPFVIAAEDQGEVDDQGRGCEDLEELLETRECDN